MFLNTNNAESFHENNQISLNLKHKVADRILMLMSNDVVLHSFKSVIFIQERKKNQEKK